MPGTGNRGCPAGSCMTAGRKRHAAARGRRNRNTPGPTPGRAVGAAAKGPRQPSERIPGPGGRPGWYPEAVVGSPLEAAEAPKGRRSKTKAGRPPVPPAPKPLAGAPGEGGSSRSHSAGCWDQAILLPPADRFPSARNASATRPTPQGNLCENAPHESPPTQRRRSLAISARFLLLCLVFFSGIPRYSKVDSVRRPRAGLFCLPGIRPCKSARASARQGPERNRESPQYRGEVVIPCRRCRRCGRCRRCRRCR